MAYCPKPVRNRGENPISLTAQFSVFMAAIMLVLCIIGAAMDSGGVYVQ